MIELFRSLSRAEVKLLGKFVHSPYFNSSNLMVLIYNYFYSLYPEITEDDLDIRKIANYVYGVKKGNKVKVRKLLSEFIKVIERFLIQLETEKNTVGNRILLLASLRDRKLDKRFEANFRNIEEMQSKQMNKNPNFYLNQMNLELESWKMYSALTESEKVSLNVQSISDNIDFYFMVSKLNNFLNMNTLEVDGLNSFPFKKDFYIEIQDYFEKNRETLEKYHTGIVIVYYALKIFVTKEEKFLDQLINYFNTHWEQFTKDQLFDYFSVLENSYQTFSNESADPEKYNIKKFDVFNNIYGDTNLFDDIHIKDGINMTEFVRVVKSGLILKKYDWVLNFIEKYHIYLPEDFKNDIYNYSKAEYFYETGQYDKSMNCIHNLRFKDEQYYYLSKIILLRIYYDLGKFDSLKYLVNNINKYCREKKSLFTPHVVRIKTFMKLLLEIVRIKNLPEKEWNENIVVLRNELERTQLIISYKKWFLKKMDEMTRRNSSV